MEQKQFLFLAQKVWVLVPGKIKECSSLEGFKSKIFHYQLRKTYLQNVGFL